MPGGAKAGPGVKSGKDARMSKAVGGMGQSMSPGKDKGKGSPGKDKDKNKGGAGADKGKA